jgi:DNA-binding MarR family transcriptional regulator
MPHWQHGRRHVTRQARATSGVGVATAATVTHPRHGLDDRLTNPVRLSIVAALASVEQAEFALVRDSIEITDPALSKQVALLEEAGYVAVDKGRVGRRPRTWLRLTDSGRAAYERHILALRAIAGLTSPDQR